MKIGDGGGITRPDDLFGRMEQAQREAQLEGASLKLVNPSGDADGNSTGVESSTRATAAGGRGGWAQIEDPVQRGLLQVAERAIDGGFDSEDELRNTVVKSIVENRYASDLDRDDAERIVRTLSATLSSDPTFRAEIDHMLLLAARELASS